MEIKRVGVIGAGQMGAGIAIVTALTGLDVILHDTFPSALDKGMAFISKHLQRAIEKGSLGEAQASDALKRINRGETIESLANIDIAIEAIVEQFDVKQQLFRSLDELLPAHSILASNTSSISITKIASCTKRPDKTIGMHFMNPVPIMKLVEIIRGLQTSDETFIEIEALAARMNKVTVIGIDRPGFIVNRILVPMVNEAIFLLSEGVEAKDIDTAMKLGTNQPMGPLELADFVGLDTLLYILRVLHNELGEDKYRPAPLLVKYVEAGWLGKKSGRGFYQY